MGPPATGEDWTGLHADSLPFDSAVEWATLPSCGAVVAFTGTVRDNSDDRPGVRELAYEAWDEQVAPVLSAIAAEARDRWPDLGRLVILHRTGRLVLGEAAVLVVASAPHRESAFAAARYLIDETKSRAPIWKKETWASGSDWAPDRAPDRVPDGVTAS